MSKGITPDILRSWADDMEQKQRLAVELRRLNGAEKSGFGFGWVCLFVGMLGFAGLWVVQNTDILQGWL